MNELDTIIAKIFPRPDDPTRLYGQRGNYARMERSAREVLTGLLRERDQMRRALVYLRAYGEAQDVADHINGSLDDGVSGFVYAISSAALNAAPQPAAQPDRCEIPPYGWSCTRKPGHDGPCAAVPAAQREARP